MMEPILFAALALVLSLTTYALLGGADYGGGVWDLFASGPSAQRQRATIAREIGPVWEANHVWLIAAVVILFTGFPRAFAAASVSPHVPLLVVRVGIVLRGSAFVFRAYGPKDPRHERLWGRVFAVASTSPHSFSASSSAQLLRGSCPRHLSDRLPTCSSRRG
jgi:cytochrome bd ubiquinol oxidase subunit II